MALYQIIETDDGLTVAEVQAEAVPEEGAVVQRGVVVDPGPYKTYEDAYDAVLALKQEEEDEDLP